jgi:hypothetical protein
MVIATPASSSPPQQGEPDDLPDDYFSTPATAAVAPKPNVTTDPFSAAIAAGVTTPKSAQATNSSSPWDTPPLAAIAPLAVAPVVATIPTPSPVVAAAPAAVAVVKPSVVVAPAPQWSTHFDAANNRHYYYESNTKTTTWIKPPELEQPVVPTPTPPAAAATAVTATVATPAASDVLPAVSLSVNTSTNATASTVQASFTAEPQTPISGGVTMFEPATPSAAVAVAKAEKEAKDAMTVAATITTEKSSSTRSSVVGISFSEGEPTPNGNSMIDAWGVCACHCHDITKVCNHCGQPPAAASAIPMAPDIEDIISPRANKEKKDLKEDDEDEANIEKQKDKRGANHIIEGPSMIFASSYSAFTPSYAMLSDLDWLCYV